MRTVEECCVHFQETIALGSADFDSAPDFGFLQALLGMAVQGRIEPPSHSRQRGSDCHRTGLDQFRLSGDRK